MSTPPKAMFNPAEREKLRAIPLTQYCRRYLAARDVTQNYSDLTFYRVRNFVRWFGEDVAISQLNCEMVNMWLTHVSETTKLSKVTISNYKRAMHAIMHFATLEGACDDAPWRLKKIKTQTQIVTSFSLREIR